MFNAKQIPILRMAARNAYENRQLSLQAYQEFMRYLDTVEADIREPVFDPFVRKQMEEALVNRGLSFQYQY